MPQGLTGYHFHFHGLTAAQVYTGLVGLLAVGRTDGNLPLVTEKRIPIRNMALQYNFVFDRAGSLAQLNNLSWPQRVSPTISSNSPRRTPKRAATWRLIHRSRIISVMCNSR